MSTFCARWYVKPVKPPPPHFHRRHHRSGRRLRRHYHHRHPDPHHLLNCCHPVHQAEQSTIIQKYLVRYTPTAVSKLNLEIVLKLTSNLRHYIFALKPGLCPTLSMWNIKDAVRHNSKHNSYNSSSFNRHHMSSLKWLAFPVAWPLNWKKFSTSWFILQKMAAFNSQ